MRLIPRESIFASTLEARIWTDHDQSRTDWDYPQLLVHPLWEFTLSSEKHCSDRLCLVSWSGATCCCVQKAAVKLALLRRAHLCQCLAVSTSAVTTAVVQSRVAAATGRTSKSLTVCIHGSLSTRSWGEGTHIIFMCPEEWDLNLASAREWGILLNKGRSYMEWAVCPAPRGCA